MSLDPHRIKFKGKAFVAAHAALGSLDSPEAEPFVEELYSEWVALGKEFSELPAWLPSRLALEFKYVDKAPRWVEEEPAWPFQDGKPMTFISQAEVGDLSPGEVVYVFGARRSHGSGFETVYRVISQFEGAA
jgi:hypothetical protein